MSFMSCVRSDRAIFVMRAQKSQIQPSHASGSLVHFKEVPFIQQGENIAISGILLHSKLKVKTKFSMWFQRRVEKYGFEEGIDYFPNLGNQNRQGHGGDRRSTDYLLSLDMAKELAMLEENEVGKAIRRYFIAKEKELRQITHLPKEHEIFKGLKLHNINGRRMRPYRQLLAKIGYNTSSGGCSGRVARYPGHFVKMGKEQLITEEFGLHLYHQKQVYNNRQALREMQPVLPFNFGEPLKLKGGPK